MEAKTLPLYVIIIILLAFVIYILTGGIDRPGLEYSKVFDKVAPPSPIVARVSIHENGDISLTTKDGDKGTPCDLKPGKRLHPRCKGLDKGDVEEVKAIPLLRTKGSICYITYDSGGGAQEVCWP